MHGGECIGDVLMCDFDLFEWKIIEASDTFMDWEQFSVFLEIFIGIYKSVAHLDYASCCWYCLCIF